MISELLFNLGIADAGVISDVPSGRPAQQGYATQSGTVNPRAH